MKHPLLMVVLLAVACGAVAIGVAALLPSADIAAPNARQPRIVSLMPPLTETLFEIGAGDLVVGRSDWCLFPPDALALPACGSAWTPNVEAVARLEPTLILGDDSSETGRAMLNALGNVEYVPWLTAEEVLAGTRLLGDLTGREEAAARLIADLEPVLLAPQPSQGPRVLLVMSHSPGQIRTVTFMRRNSLHGRLLHYAGARNAADFDVRGMPSLSIERLIELDPEIIVVLAVEGELDDSARAGIMADWETLKPLQAVQQGRVGILEGRQLVPAGRRTLQLAEALKQEIARLAD